MDCYVIFRINREVKLQSAVYASNFICLLTNNTAAVFSEKHPRIYRLHCNNDCEETDMGETDKLFKIKFNEYLNSRKNKNYNKSIILRSEKTPLMM